MFLPLDQKPDWRNPPLVTLILVIANVMIFYMWQFSDEKHEREAYEYYSTSGLDIIELKRYIKYKKLENKVTEKDLTRVTNVAIDTYTEMRLDGEFQKKLFQREIIKPDDPNFVDWDSKRKKFDAYRDRVVSYKYALNPSQPSTTTYLTSMFLHGDNGHLWGNMVMLVLLGLGVEILLGRLLFFVGYMISGLAASQLYIILQSDTFSYGIGASGAIAGVLGMAVMIYGLRKIYFFYFLFVYFDFIRARAIWIIPLYILSQAIIEFVFESNINVAAHVGGFIGGLAFTGIIKLIPNAINKTEIDKSQNKANYEKEYAAAQRLVTSMNIEEAKDKFEALAKDYPNDINIQQQLFGLAKYNPASEEYHQYAQKLLNLSGSDASTVKTIHDTYRHYASKAKPKPRWTPELLCNIAIKFAANKKLSDAEKIINYLCKAAENHPGNPAALSALTKYFNGVDADKSVLYKQKLLELYPNSDEARALQQQA